MDKSNPGIFIREGKNNNKDKAIIYLMGGGYCVIKNCIIFHIKN
jgi:acetyl esterase/lipase